MKLKQLAETLGLSQTTVSRALNGYPEVAEATRARVVSAASAHNYTPNARARGLATGRAMAFGHVIPLSDQREIVNPVFADFIAGAGEVYSQHGFDLVLSMVSDSDQEHTFRDAVARGKVDGVIVNAPRVNDPRIEMLTQIGVPFVVHGRSMAPDDSYAWVDVNNRRAFRRATEFLLDLGHRRIALINGHQDMAFARRRFQGYCDALTARGVLRDPALSSFDEMSEGVGFEMTQRLLAGRTPPTAILASSIVTAFGVRRALDTAGLRIGRDVSVITHDDDLSYLRNDGPIPIFTAIRSSVRRAGQLCAERLIQRVQSPDQPLGGHLLEAEFIMGESTGPAPRPE